MFTGFNEKTTEFLWGIRFNNNREWFLENKQIYLDHLQTPMRALANDVWTCMTKKNKLDINYHVTRIYRDARRVKSGGLYKESLWFSMEKDRADEWTATPGFFFEISPEGYMYGIGYYAAPATTMKKFRDRLDAHPAEFERIAEDLKKKKIYEIFGDEYSRKKAEKEGVLAEWYNRKTLGVIAEFKGHEKLQSPTFVKMLCNGFQTLLPLYSFLCSIEGELNP